MYVHAHINDNIMKKLRTIIALSATIISLTATAQATDGVYTTVYDDSQTADAQAWIDAGTWRNGFTANAHPSVNAVEFRTQYERNQQQWDAMFQWLATHDLTTIEHGKYPIEGTTLTVSVEDSSNQPITKRRSESHYHHIDFQFVVKGTERFAILDHNTSSPNTEYQPDVIRYAYDADRLWLIDSEPDKFLIFFPCDWHIAKLATDNDDQTIRVIVVKLDYID